MTKKLFVSFAVFAASVFLSLGVFHLTSLAGLNKWIYLCVSAALAVIALVLTVVFYKRGPQLYVLPVNSVSMGLAISALYAHLGAVPPVWQSAAVFGCASALFLLFISFARVPFLKRHTVIYLVTFAVIVGAGIIVGGVLTQNTAFALSAFVYSYLIGFPVAAVIPSSDRKAFLNKLVFASFVLVFVAIFAVLTVISEGETLDAIAPDAPSAKKRKNNRKL